MFSSKVVAVSSRDIDSRRRFLRLAAGAAAATVLAGGVPRVLRADSEAAPIAEAQSCIDDTVEGTDAKLNVGDACTNCQFYTGKSTSHGGGCIFHSVASDLCW